MSLARSTGTALVLALAAALAPTAAHADSHLRNDPSGDVTKVVFDPDGAVVQPTRAEGDIVRSRVAHGPYRIKLKLRLRGLTRTPDEVLYDLHIRTKTHVRQIVLTAGPGEWRGGIDLYNREGNDARCRGIRWSIDYARDLVKVSIPRRCLGNPRWVRAGMNVATFVGDDLYTDDAMTNGQDVDSTVYGPRVYR